MIVDVYSNDYIKAVTDTKYGPRRIRLYCQGFSILDPS